MTRPGNSCQLILALLLAVCVIGCGPTDEVGPDPSPTPLPVDEGWKAFQAGNFGSAASMFAEAIASDPGDSEAHNGLGWARLRMSEWAEALASFDAAIDHGFSAADPHVGKAIILRDYPPVDYAAAISAAELALSIDKDYVFAYDPRLDWQDVRLILAQSYFAAGEYLQANGQVSLLGGNVQDPNSETFVADLLLAIQALGEQIGGD